MLPNHFSWLLVYRLRDESTRVGGQSWHSCSSSRSRFQGVQRAPTTILYSHMIARFEPEFFGTWHKNWRGTLPTQKYWPGACQDVAQWLWLGSVLTKWEIETLEKVDNFGTGALALGVASRRSNVPRWRFLTAIWSRGSNVNWISISLKPKG